MAISVSCSLLVSALIRLFYSLQQGPVSWKDYVSSVTIPALCTLLAAASSFALQYYVLTHIQSSLLRLAALTLGFGCIYLICTMNLGTKQLVKRVYAAAGFGQPQ